MKKSILPAALLAVITIFVFYTLRDFGPVSAARRFHEDLASHNLNDLQKVCSEPLFDPRVNRDVTAIGQLLIDRLDEEGATPRLAGEQRSPSEVDVLVMYQKPDGSAQPFVWVVVKREIGWQVDPRQTVLANRAL